MFDEPTDTPEVEVLTDDNWMPAADAKWLPDDPDAEAFSDEDNNSFARKVISLFRLTVDESRKRIAEAIENPAKYESLELGERILRDQIVMVYFFDLESQMRQELIKILNIDLSRIDDIFRNALHEMGGDVPEGLTDEDQPLLPLTFPDEKKPNEIKTYHVSKASKLEITKLLIDADTFRIFSDINGKGVRFNVANKKSDKIYVLASLTADPSAPQPITPLTAFEKRVENAVGNLYDEGYTIITPRMIFFKMRGRQTNDISAKMIEKIERAMLKLEATWVKIDYTDQWRAKHPNDTETRAIYSKIIAFDRVEVKNKQGKLIQCAYSLQKVPVFYGYSKEIGQVFTYPSIALDIPDASITEQMIVLTGIMLEHLALISRKGACNIRVDTILSKLGIENPTKNQRIDVINSIRKILAHWKEIGLLRKMAQSDEVKKGNEIIAFAMYPKKRRGKK